MRAKVDALLRLVEARGCAAPKMRTPPHANAMEDLLKTNIIAFSGGVDSSLAAKIVHQVFPQSSVACLGISPSLSKQQLEQAREVARHIRIPLWECYTTESQNEKYVENKGQRCVWRRVKLQLK
uniref:NAD/GMP synthase domain-containing protein n=1 Tax=Globisporangium ultimum (strain ATCC 200006 / CBS 805.95 / DAOM BR144) TaxID=431595 RepID=K3W5K4_GLOUD